MTADTPEGTFRLEIFLVSFAALMLEISYTRFISFKLFYYYTYLVIGLALLGIGLGGVLVAISKRLHEATTETIVKWSLLCGGLSVLAGYIITARLGIDTLAIWEYTLSGSLNALARLVLICIALFASFVAVGIVIATLFSRHSEQIGRLYFADLTGAGLACAVVVSLIKWFGPPSTILLAGLVLALAGLRLVLKRHDRMLAPAVILVVVLAATVAAPSILPKERTDKVKLDLTTVTPMFSKWSPIFRVDVIQSLGVRLLYHDGLIGSAIYPYNGHPSSLTRFDTDARTLPFQLEHAPPKRELIIGAAGGNEVLASLHFHAGHIDAIELNPVTYNLVADTFAKFSGHLTEIPNVNFVNGDGRSYLARSDKHYNLIWYPAPDSYAASNAVTAGAYVLSESYLYTSNAIVDSLEHLNRGGILAVQFGEVNFKQKPNRTTRYVATARQALHEMGIDDASHHILVATSPSTGFGKLSTILVKRTPFTRGEVTRFVDSIGLVPNSELRFAPGGRYTPTPVSRAITTPRSKLDHFFASYAYDVSPISDDTPFFWHFARFDTVIQDFTKPLPRADPEDTVGERVLLLLLGVAVVLAAIFLLLPFLAIRTTWAALPRKGTSAIYFAALGLGFLFFEITLIQRFILFLGYPTYSLTVTLLSILIFTGIGALLSARIRPQRHRVVPALVVAITVLTVFYLFALPPITDGLLGLPLALRVLFTFLALGPLGICLGTFMPMGIGAVAAMTEHSREYVAWGWAVNGFASVIGSVLTTILAMTFGFKVVLALALGTYLVALAALWSLLRSTPAGTLSPAVEAERAAAVRTAQVPVSASPVVQ